MRAAQAMAAVFAAALTATASLRLWDRCPRVLRARHTHAALSGCKPTHRSSSPTTTACGSRPARAARLSRSPARAGLEFLPKFSPDGQSVAFSANYDGTTDIYSISVAGGLPKRLTTLALGEFVTGYAPDGRVVFASSASIRAAS